MIPVGFLLYFLVLQSNYKVTFHFRQRQARELSFSSWIDFTFWGNALSCFAG